MIHDSRVRETDRLTGLEIGMISLAKKPADAGSLLRLWVSLGAWKLQDPLRDDVELHL